VARFAATPERVNFLRAGANRGQLWAVSSVGSSPEAGLRGRLEQFGLATVLTFLDLERRSGELTVVAGDKVGRLWLRRGRVLRARLEGSRRASKSVVYDLLALERGRFSFTQSDLDGIADEIDAPTTLLLMEAARRADEASASPSL
jgi:two-component system, OmpR family, response regulator